jgi:phosphoribosyl-ATP pyrophosphohydrolase/phosphoribosyl-AMP cyclohydrolase
VLRPAPDVALNWTDGLLPCVVADARTGVVLMLAWMNQEAFERTRQTGEAWFWSRSRQSLWRKGETSGHTQRVVDLRYDCDGDALVAEVIPDGPACHTGRTSCFHYDADGRLREDGGPALARLAAVIAERARTRPPGSYTAALLEGGIETVGAKVEEEAGELVRAGRAESDERVAEEAADLVYHLLVLLASRGVLVTKVLDVLIARRA